MEDNETARDLRLAQSDSLRVRLDGSHMKLSGAEDNETALLYPGVSYTTTSDEDDDEEADGEI